MGPVLYPPHTRFALELTRWAVAPPGSAQSALSEPHELDDAASWFSTSLKEGFDLPPQHQAMLARWLLDRGDAKRAAKHFLTALEGHLRLEVENEAYGELKAELHVATARALSKAGERIQAEDVLRRCTDARLPGFGAAYRLLAELQAEDTHYEEAFDTLNRWAEANPELESDVCALRR